MSKTEKATKVYTRGGDKGQTSLVGGKRVLKSDTRLEAYGTVDELNSVIGLLICEIRSELPASEAVKIRPLLDRIQFELFNVGSRLACEDEALLKKMPVVSEARITELEAKMDEYSAELKRLTHFILPGGSRSASTAHLARTVARRAERATAVLGESHPTEEILLRYLNRLSDYFFVLARHCNFVCKVDEPIWQPEKQS